MNTRWTSGFFQFLLLILSFAASPTSAQLSNTFETNSEGWRACDINPVSHLRDISASSANYWQNGKLRVGDVYGWTFITAPVAYLGNWSGAYGGTISYEITISYTDGVDYPAIVLQGLTKTIYYVRPTPQVNVTSVHSATIQPGNWKLNSYLGPQATEKDIRDVLKHVISFSIMTEWNTGPDDTLIDNVQTSFTPIIPAGIGITARSLSQKPASSTTNKYLYRCWGKITSVNSTFIAVDDGSKTSMQIFTDTTGLSVGQTVVAKGYRRTGTSVILDAPREWLTFF